MELQQALQKFSFLFWHAAVIPKYLNCATFSMILLAVFMLWFSLALCWQDSNICIAFSMCTSWLTSLEAPIKVPVFFLMVSMLDPCKFTSTTIEADMPYSNLVSYDFLPHCINIRAHWKTVVIKHFFVLDCSDYEKYQRNVYLYRLHSRFH